MLTAALRATPMSADAFAEAALRQIDADRAVIVIPASASRFYSAYRHLPGLFDRAARQQMAHTLAQLDAQKLQQA